MEKKKMKAENVRLAKVKYYDVDHNGVEVNDMDAYAFLYLNGESYVNLFDVCEDLPVFERVPYSNTTLSGEDFGTKLKLVSGDDSVSGACYVLERENAKEMFGTDEIDLSVLQKYLLKSSKFFVDRLGLLEDKNSNINKRLYYHTYLADQKRMEELKKYINSHEKVKTYTK